MKKFLMIVLGIILMIGGITLMLRPGMSFVALGWFIGVAVLINGITHIILWFQKKNQGISGWYLASGILGTICGIILIGDVVLSISLEMVLIYAAAIWFLIDGVIKIVTSFKVKGLPGDEGKNWWAILLAGILFIICGCLSLANPTVLMLAVGMLFGINMMMCGIDLISLSSVVD